MKTFRSHIEDIHFSELELIKDTLTFFLGLRGVQIFRSNAE